MNHTTFLISKEDLTRLEGGETVVIAKDSQDEFSLALETDNDRIDREEDEYLTEMCQAMIDEVEGNDSNMPEWMADRDERYPNM